MHNKICEQSACLFFKNMGKAENKVESTIVDNAAKYGCMQRKVTAIGSTGFPDRLVVGHGYTVFVELKTLTGEPSARQKLTINELREHGAIAYIIDTKEDCLALLQHMRDHTLQNFEPTCRHNRLNDSLYQKQKEGLLQP